MIKSESIVKIAAAIVKAQSEMGNAIKDSTNPFFKSKYADLLSVLDASLPALNKNGISVLQPTIVQDGKNYVQTILMHESGEYISGITEIKVKEANNPQAEGSGISYARRYGLSALVSIGVADDDGNAASGKKYEEDNRWQAPHKAEPQRVMSQSHAVETKALNDAGSYVCKIKPFKDTQLRKIPAAQLAEHCTYLSTNAAEDGTALSGDAKELMDNARKYLISINYYAPKKDTDGNPNKNLN